MYGRFVKVNKSRLIYLLNDKRYKEEENEKLATEVEILKKELTEKVNTLQSVQKKNTEMEANLKHLKQKYEGEKRLQSLTHGDCLKQISDLKKLGDQKDSQMKKLKTTVGHLSNLIGNDGKVDNPDLPSAESQVKHDFLGFRSGSPSTSARSCLPCSSYSELVTGGWTW